VRQLRRKSARIRPLEPLETSGWAVRLTWAKNLKRDEAFPEMPKTKQKQPIRSRVYLDVCTLIHCALQCSCSTTFVFATHCIGLTAARLRALSSFLTLVLSLPKHWYHRTSWIYQPAMAISDGASSISVTIRVRPFTIREAAQLTKCDDSTIFLGEGSLAAAPTAKLNKKGLRPIIKVVDDKCL